MKIDAITQKLEEGLESLLNSDKDRSIKEIEAESVAYTVCQHFGIETGEYSFGYLASWSGGDRDALKKSMAAIQQTADKIITGI